jgi:hypothetical protein
MDCCGRPCLAAAIINDIYKYELEDSSEISKSPTAFAAVFLLSLLYPLQGFLNVIVYIRQKDDNPEMSCWFWAYRQVLSGKRAPTTKRTAHLAKLTSLRQKETPPQT